MTFRSRAGGPAKKRGAKKHTHTRKLHHPPPPPVEEQPPPPPPSSLPLPSSLESGPFNPPDSEILALLHRALHQTVSSDEFVPTVQRIKGLLYDKKWLEVFCGPESVLESYAGRWVPSRACSFRELMDKLVGEVFNGQGASGLAEQMGNLAVDEDESEEDDDEEPEEGEEEGGEGEGEGDADSEEEREAEDEDNNEADGKGLPASSQQPQSTSGDSIPRPTHHILSLGGGAGSELLAVTALIRSVQINRPHSHPKWTWTGIDIGNWHNVLKKMEDAVKIDWKIDSDMLEVEYIKGDLLALPPTSSSTATSTSEESKTPSGIDLANILITKPPKLITLFFTLTELLSQSRPKTLSLIKTLTEHSPPGTPFLIVDSASDISDFSLGPEGRKYPVYMVIDALLSSKGRGWEKVRGEDSRWFRFDEGVGAGWKVKLENTRYWYRLYRRI
ncbi:uncharacterized protein IL334_006392 [Kwoniella shivajii]|uniref:Cytoplasmic protein n=1 Tax=Kwoniella shivajii TaxID=564305 RepID=A0ABZ1D719_9TREE|nr:hypothetical protein IL334_006392 [Kwoniella shivajii]